MNTNKNTHFIYNPAEKRAYFSKTIPTTNSAFICGKSGLSLYLLCSGNKERAWTPSIDYEPLYIPLIKSNLQKAVRRKDLDIAESSLLYLLSTDKTSLLRRLPIIMIEDVCLLDSMPILVWFMIADKDYVLTDTDIQILRSILATLIKTDATFYNDTAITPTEVMREDIMYSDSLLSMYYRMLYGGMKGDMDMLKRAIVYYKTNPQRIVATDYTPLSEPILEASPSILWESIDFHPYPALITKIAQDIDIHRTTVKELIWNAESGYNSRKTYTRARSQKARTTPEWQTIEPILTKYREAIVSTPQYTLEEISTHRATFPSS